MGVIRDNWLCLETISPESWSTGVGSIGIKKPITPILHLSSTPKRYGVNQGLLSPLSGGINQNQILRARILSLITDS
ncbi:MAG: hypothetical protein QGG48_07570 [Desulfatiglandales bacterium]|jgi:hypothetical protein|nr:hypothetical protein [Desulfatiglandales bacterium]